MRDNRAFVRFYFDRVYKNEDPSAIAVPLVRDEIIEALTPGGMTLLVHSRSVHDDEQGPQYKDIGAKAVPGGFIDDARMGVVGDDTHETYRITLLRRDGYGAA